MNITGRFVQDGALVTVPDQLRGKAMDERYDPSAGWTGCSFLRCRAAKSKGFWLGLALSG